MTSERRMAVSYPIGHLVARDRVGFHNPKFPCPEAEIKNVSTSRQTRARHPRDATFRGGGFRATSFANAVARDKEIAQ